MTPVQDALARERFAKVAPIRNAAAALFNERPFAVDPSARPPFRGDMKAAVLALATGSPRAAGGTAGAVGGFERSRGSNGVQFNGIPASGLTVAAVALPDGIVLGR